MQKIAADNIIRCIESDKNTELYTYWEKAKEMTNKQKISLYDVIWLIEQADYCRKYLGAILGAFLIQTYLEKKGADEN